MPTKQKTQYRYSRQDSARGNRSNRSDTRGAAPNSRNNRDYRSSEPYYNNTYSSRQAEYDYRTRNYEPRQSSQRTYTDSRTSYVQRSYTVDRARDYRENVTSYAPRSYTDSRTSYAPRSYSESRTSYAPRSYTGSETSYAPRSYTDSRTGYTSNSVSYAPRERSAAYVPREQARTYAPGDYAAAPAPVRTAEPKVRVLTEGERRANKRKFKARIKAIAAIGIIFFMCLAMLYGQAAIFGKNQEIESLESEYGKVLVTNEGIQAEIDKSIELGNLESIAKNRLGMISPDSSQVFYVDMGAKDEVVRSSSSK